MNDEQFESLPRGFIEVNGAKYHVFDRIDKDTWELMGLRGRWARLCRDNRRHISYSVYLPAMVHAKSVVFQPSGQ
jgi:hypothetical protein